MIGRSSSGTIYHAIWNNNQCVAIKVIKFTNEEEVKAAKELLNILEGI
uniref:Uncharacterized protein n=1 Tax=Meloidogyne enterolobii TaxID=390850 RepID=A0A6V7Y278_MELEN|nr:unnamed protein product [Meloidogyne enterolobii]